MSFSLFFNFAYQFGDYAAFLLLAALGLIIVLGIADIINLAHGEFIMLGAYGASISYHQGLPFPLAVVIAAVAVGILGLILERLIIRRFYGDRIGALVATWGLSLVLSQGILILFGPSMPPIPHPELTVRVGDFSYSGYRIVLMAVAMGVLAFLWLVMYRSRLGMTIRATIQNPDMARCLGTDTTRINMITFATGAALAGLTGALYAPTTTIGPTFGTPFIAPAFITVVVGGGANPIIGALSSSGLLSAATTPTRIAFGTFAGLISLLLGALVIIRFLPNGISGYVRGFRRRRIAETETKA